MKAYLLTAAVVALLLPSRGIAGYVDDYKTWKTTPTSWQTTYLQGALDGWLQSGEEDETRDVRVRRDGILSCLSKQKFDANQAVELVNNHYKGNPVDWRVAPAPVLFHELLRMCMPEINEERNKLGLSPWPLLLPSQIINETPAP